MTLWEDNYPEFYVLVSGENIVTVTGDKREAESLVALAENIKILVCVVDHVSAI